MKSQINKFDHNWFHGMPIIGILRNISTEDLPHILDAFYRAGLTTIEITMNSPGVRAQISYVVEHYHDRLNIGAGTVRNREELDIALEAGASFIVSPNVDEAVINSCTERGIPIFSGALTPTEVYSAHRLGASKIKVFPASVMGPGYFKSLKGPLDTIPLIATGGIDSENMTEYLKAGASGLGIGSTLFDKDLIAQKEWDALYEHMKKYVEVIKSWV